jgi:hypothetical protein
MGGGGFGVGVARAILSVSRGDGVASVRESGSISSWNE